jgi:hypothetical protein
VRREENTRKMDIMEGQQGRGDKGKKEKYSEKNQQR